MSKWTWPRGWAVCAMLAYLAFVFVVTFALKLGDMPLPEYVFQLLHEFQSRGFLVGVRFGHVEAAANVLLFIPLWLLLPLALKRHPFVGGWLAAVGLSIGIEVTQYLFLSGRVASIRDVICNALGAAFGVLLCLGLTVAGRRRRTRSARRIHN